MRRLTYLAAATAATAALSLIPLTLASSASASATPAVSTATPTTNWAGYVAKIPARYGIADQFGWVEATFTVPKTSCNDSVESSLSHLRPKGQLYSAAAFWVGLGGVNNKLLEQDGIQAWCGSKNAAPVFGAFYQMVPADGSGYSVGAALYNKSGKSIVIHANDRIVADTWDYSTQSEATSHPYKPGRVYRFLITDLTQNAKSNIRLQIFNPGTLGSDNTAEVVTEAINQGPWHGPDYTGIAHFQPVSYSSIQVGLNGGGYTYGISPGPNWTAAMYYVHGGLFGLLGLSSPHTLISTGGLSKGGHAFTNYWHKF